MANYIKKTGLLIRDPPREMNIHPRNGFGRIIMLYSLRSVSKIPDIISASSKDSFTRNITIAGIMQIVKTIVIKMYFKNFII